VSTPWRCPTRPAVLAELAGCRHAVIEASAGTGKTFTIEHLVVDRLLDRDVTIDQILVVTFTEKAAAELRVRIRALLEKLLRGDEGGARPPAAEAGVLTRALSDIDQATIATIHGFCYRVLGEHAFASGQLLVQAQVDGRAAFGRAFREALREDLARIKSRRDLLAELLGAGKDVAWLENLLYECTTRRGRLLPPAAGATHEAALTAAAVAELLPVVRRRCQQNKRRLGQLDFDDMLEIVRASLAWPRGDALARSLRARYRVALIDEFQDTDDVQWEIFSRLFFAGSDEPGRSLYLVGDPKQAIYSFRGADVHTYLAARAQVVARGGARVALRDSFRATAPVIAAQNAILDQSALPPFFAGSIRYDAPVRCGRPDVAALGPEGEPAAPVVLFHLVGDGANTSDLRLSGLGLRMGHEILRLLDPARPLLRIGPPGALRALAARDIFVLTRKTKEGQRIGEALRRLGVPCSFYKQDGLFQTHEAADIASLLAAIDDPHDRSKRIRAWSSPFFGLSLEDLTACADVPGSHPLLQRLFEWRALAQRKQYDHMFARILEQTGLIRREAFTRTGERELTNYLHIFEVLLEEAGRTGGNLRELRFALQGFIDSQTNGAPLGPIDRNVQRLESERDAVQIMTMHMAKGLEADVVFLAGGFTGLRAGPVATLHQDGERVLALDRASAKDALERESAEEEQRLLYVALTRARARVYLPYVGPVKARAVPAGATGAEGGTDSRTKAATPRAARPPTGPYRFLNAQLRRIVDGAAPEVARLFSRELVDCPAAAAADGARRLHAVVDWSVPPAPAPARTAAYAVIRAQRPGTLITSYSQLRVHAGGRARVAADRLDGEDPALRDLGELAGGSRATVRDDGAGDELPVGMDAGGFLHAVIEELDLPELAGASTVSEWRARPAVSARLGAAARRHGIDERVLPHAAALVYRALRSTIVLGPGRAIAGLASAAQSVRELEFLFPVARPPGPAVFVQGFIDYVFVHEGLVYFADWKTDALADSHTTAAAEHVARHYTLQVRLYSLALTRTLAIRDERDYEDRFGGALYCFVRAMADVGDGTAGVCLLRPTWSELLAGQDELARDQPAPGGSP
jgi:exodeoxyribonuclease V beta subunit